MRYQAAGAQRASTSGRGTQSTTSRDPVAALRWTLSPDQTSSFRAIAALLLAAIVAAGGMTVLAAPAVRAGSDVAGRKAVIIVGPASSSTREYLDEGERIARQAENQGMDVRRVFTPRATWKRVKQNIQGANLVVYLGHGNGWPSHMGPFRGESKNGFGLNPCEGECGTSGPTKYYGEDFLRAEIQLARDAVVLLHRLCYASGNAESGMAPVFNRDLATERASNFAAGFLAAGAGVVFALGWDQKVNLPEVLSRSNRTMDEIFMMRGSDDRDAYDGFIGWDDYYRQSTRTKRARVHLDPHKRHGHLRAITGDLELTANAWRGEVPPPDEVAPTLRVRGTGTTDDTRAAGADKTLTFSPDGDGVADRMLVRRTLSEPAHVDVEVWNADGTPIRRFTRFGEAGAGETFWDGRSDGDRIVDDGIYHVHLTPRDRAGNVGETASVEVKVLTSLRRLKSDTSAIHVNDHDRLADQATFSAVLRQDATVTWQVRRRDRVVRTRYKDESLAAGDLQWRWDGKDKDGATVPDGRYEVIIAATTQLGTLRYRQTITVGNWRVAVDDRTPRRGQEVRIVARSLEALRAGARLEITEAGLAPRTVAMKVQDRHQAIATFRVSRKAGDGPVRLRVLATDTGGGQESTSLKLRLR